MLADDLHARALADERHQRVAGDEALRMMDQTYLEPMQRMSRRQQLEISKMRGQNQCAFARIFLFELVPDVDPIVGDPAPEPAIKKSAEPDVLRRGPAQILVRRKQALPALGISALGKRYFEIAYPDPRVTLVEMKGEPSAGDSERIQDEVGKDAQRMDYRNQDPED